MWLLVSVVKGSKYHEPDSLIDNRIMVSDTTDMIISGRSTGNDGYRFEMRKGNESFVVQDFPSGSSKAALTASFIALASRIGAKEIANAA